MSGSFIPRSPCSNLSQTVESMKRLEPFRDFRATLRTFWSMSWSLEKVFCWVFFSMLLNIIIMYPHIFSVMSLPHLHSLWENYFSGISEQLALISNVESPIKDAVSTEPTTSTQYSDVLPPTSPVQSPSTVTDLPQDPTPPQDLDGKLLLAVPTETSPGQPMLSCPQDNVDGDSEEQELPSPVVTEHTVAKSAVIPLKQQQLEAMSLQENKDDTQQELSSSLTYHGGRPLSLRAISFKKQSVKGHQKEYTPEELVAIQGRVRSSLEQQGVVSVKKRIHIKIIHYMYLFFAVLV